MLLIVGRLDAARRDVRHEPRDGAAEFDVRRASAAGRRHRSAQSSASDRRRCRGHRNPPGPCIRRSAVICGVARAVGQPERARTAALGRRCERPREPVSRSDLRLAACVERCAHRLRLRRKRDRPFELVAVSTRREAPGRTVRPARKPEVTIRKTHHLRAFSPRRAYGQDSDRRVLRKRRTPPDAIP